MKRFLMTVLLILAYSSVGQAQTRELYFGLGVSYATFSGLSPNYPQPSVQVGGLLSEMSALELRGTFTSLLLSSTLGLDVLYPVGLDTATARLYVGGGIATRFYLYAPTGLELEAIFGGEFFFESEPSASPSGFFGEIQTSLLGLVAGFPGLEVRAGLNFPL